MSQPHIPAKPYIINIAENSFNINTIFLYIYLSQIYYYEFVHNEVFHLYQIILFYN